MSLDDKASHTPSPRAGSTEPAPPPPDLFPTLSTLDSGRENTLENLAQHAVELHDSAMEVGDVNDIGLAGFHHEDNSFFTATGEARFGMLDEEGERRDGANNGAQHDDFAQFETLDSAGVDTSAAIEAARNEIMGRMRAKRRREEDGLVGPVENGEPIDPIKMKKESHKEVERRRRENINEGIMDIVAQVPGGSDPKVGKGILLKRAADYLQNLKNKVEHLTVEMASKDREKQEYATELDRVRALLEKAEAESIKYEEAWRNAEDRVAKGQFELEEARKRISELEPAT